MPAPSPKRCAAVEALNLDNAGSPSGRVTISLGVACAHPQVQMTSHDLLLTAGDQSLYRAKNNGRNRVEGTVGISERGSVLGVG